MDDNTYNAIQLCPEDKRDALIKQSIEEDGAVAGSKYVFYVVMSGMILFGLIVMR